MLRSAVLELATSFRLAVKIVVETGNVSVHTQGLPRGCCGINFELMGDYLNTVGDRRILLRLRDEGRSLTFLA